MAEQSDIFCNEGIIGSSTITTVGTMRIVLAKDGVTSTHFMVIPMEHRDHIDEFTGQETADFNEALSLIRHVAERRGIASYRLISMVGAESGSTIAHYHMHVIGVTSADRNDEKFGILMANPGARPIHYSIEELPKRARELRAEFDAAKGRTSH